MHNRETADPAIDIVIDVSEFFYRRSKSPEALASLPVNIVLDPGIGFRKTPEQSNGGSRRSAHWQAVRTAASGRRLAQALHRLGFALGAESSGSAARSPRTCSHREWRGHHAHPDVAPRRCSAATSPPPTGGPMSDHIFVNGPALHAYHGVMPHEARSARPSSSISRSTSLSREASRSDKLEEWSPTTGSSKMRARFCARRYRLSKPRPAPRRTRCSARFPKSRRCASTCTSRMLRSPRPSPTSASSSQRAVSRKMSDAASTRR